MSQDQEEWPTVTEIRALIVLLFGSLETSKAYMIIPFEKKTKEYRSERKQNLHLELREKDSIKNLRKCAHRVFWRKL